MTDIGGNAAEEVARFEVVALVALVDWVWAPKGVGALVDMGGNAAEEVELDSNEGIVFALGVTKDDGDDVCAIDDPYAGFGAFPDIGG